jgi:hypothetical protein
MGTALILLLALYCRDLGRIGWRGKFRQREVKIVDNSDVGMELQRNRTTYLTTKLAPQQLATVRSHQN